MRKILALCLFGASLVPHLQAQSSLSFSRTISLPGVTGKFDHLAIDSKGNRLFIAATGKHSVEVVDLKTDKIQQSIQGLGKPHGLAWVAETGSLYVADGALAELRVYTGSPLSLAGTIKLSSDADDMVYDAARHQLFVGHGTGEAASPARVAVIDIANFTLTANIAVATHPEALDLDAQGGRVFVNVADSAEVAVIDSSRKEIVAHWKLTKAADNVPMAYDSAQALLYVACRTPGTLLVLDAVNGKEIASAASASGADDLFFDPMSQRLFLISGLGEVDAYQAEAKTLHALGVVKTAVGAKTALFVPDQNLLYVMVPGVGNGDAEVRVFTAGKPGDKK